MEQTAGEVEATRGLRGWVLPALALVLVIGVLLTAWSVHLGRQKAHGHLLRQGSLIVHALMGGELVTATDAFREGLTPAGAERLERQLAAMLSADPAYRRIVLVGRPGGEDRLLAAAEPPGAGTPRRAGRLELALGEAVERAFASSRAAVLAPGKGSAPGMAHAAVPFVDPVTDVVRAVLVLGVDASAWRAPVLAAARVPLATTAGLGVVLLAGAALARRRDGRPQEGGGGEGTPGPGVLRYVEAGTVAGTGLILTLAAVWAVGQAELRSREEAFAHVAHVSAGPVAEAFADLERIELEGLARLYESSLDVGADEFMSYTGHLQANAAVQAWEWVPGVPADEKRRFEARVRATGIEEFRIWELAPDGRRVPASGRAVYYPVLRVAPLQENAAAMGYDLGSEPMRRAALEEAAQTGLVTGTDPIRLVQETGRQQGMLLYRPVYAADEPRRLRGFAVAVLRFGTALERSVITHGPVEGKLDMTLWQLRPEGPAVVLAATGSADAAPASPAALGFVHPVLAFGHAYAVGVSPGRGYASASVVDAGWMTGLAGAVATAGFALAFAFAARRRHDLECEVRERTAELRASEEQLVATLHSIGDGVIGTDRDARVVRLNTVAEKLTGWSSREARGHPMDEVFRIHDATTGAPTESPVRRALDAGVVVELANHTVLTSRDGTRRPIADSCAPILATDGGVTGAVLVFRDVTAEHRARAQIQRVRERLELAADSAGIGVWELDVAGGRLEWDAWMFRLYGRDPATFEPDYESWRAGLHPDDRPRVAAEVETALVDQDRFESEFRIVRPDGEVRHLKATAAMQRDAAGRAVRMTGVNYDITGLKRAQAELREASLRQEQAVRGGGVGLWDWHLESGRVSYSGEWKRQVGCEEAEIGDSYEEWRSRVHPEDLGPTLALVEEALGSGARGWSTEFRFRHKDGSYRWILAQATVLRDADGRPVRAMGSHVDITVRKRAEEEHERLQAQLLQSQKMESVGRLAGGIAHDSNNMLGIILGYVELALMKTPPEAPIHADLRQVQKAAQRSADLTRQLLAFARKQTVARQVLDLNAVVEGMLEMLRRLIGEDIALAWSPGEALWRVQMDPGQVEQVLANLCVNARDAITGVGQLEIQTRNRVVDEAAGAHGPVPPGRYVLLRVRDDGSGMPPEVLERVFEPFFTTKAQGEGTGLGLATVYGIVHQNQGVIDVESSPGAGTTFGIYLPCHDGPPPSTRAAASTPARDAREETVLLVEDEPEMLKMTRALLEELGHPVVAAGSPAEALRQGARHADRIRLLVTDVIMPEMNGQELARRIRERVPGAAVLFMSGYPDEVIARHGVLAEGTHLLQKPFTLDGLAQAVSAVLGAAPGPASSPGSGKPAPRTTVGAG